MYFFSMSAVIDPDKFLWVGKMWTNHLRGQQYSPHCDSNRLIRAEKAEYDFQTQGNCYSLDNGDNLRLNMKAILFIENEKV